MPIKFKCTLKRGLLFSISFGFVIILGIIGFFGYQFYYTPMLPTSFQPIIFTVYPNQSATQLIQRFAANQWVQNPGILGLLVRFLKYDRSLKAGVYRIEKGETVMQFLDAIVHARVMRLPFRIPEGSTYNEIENLLFRAPFLVINHVIPRNAGSTTEPRTPNPSYLEGLFLADTYYYDAGSSSRLLLNQAHQAQMKYLNKAWQERDPNLPYHSDYELLIVASILEKEASLPLERQIISGIVVNRLNKHMRLQMDPTVIYGLGSSFLGKLTYKDLKYDSPYNTYINAGLPPTPIAMVSRNAIEAAAHPLKSSYLYYVAKGDGSHKFSITYKDQQQAIKQIRN